MDFTKDELTLLRHGLDIVCRTEAGGLGQTGLNGLKDGRVNVLTDRLKLATGLDARMNEEYARLEDLEKAEQAANSNGAQRPAPRGKKKPAAAQQQGQEG